MNRQRGVSVIVVVVAMLMLSAMIMLTLERSTLGTQDSLLYQQRVEALMLAESMIDRLEYAYKSAGTCSIDPDPAVPPNISAYTFANGTVAAIAVDASVANHCIVTVEATVGLVTRTLQVDLAITSTMGGLYEPFRSLADFNWIEVSSLSHGFSGWDVENCPQSVCAITELGSGSLNITAQDDGSGSQYVGYYRRGVSPPIETGAGTDLTFSLGYYKEGRNSGAAQFHMYMDLHDTAKNFTFRVWSNTAVPSGNAWKYWESVVSLPAGYSFDQVRLGYDLTASGASGGGGMGGGGGGWGWGRLRNQRDASVWFDNIRITTPAGIGGSALFGWAEL